MVFFIMKTTKTSFFKKAAAIFMTAVMTLTALHIQTLVGAISWGNVSSVKVSLGDAYYDNSGNTYGHPTAYPYLIYAKNGDTTTDTHSAGNHSSLWVTDLATGTQRRAICVEAGVPIPNYATYKDKQGASSSDNYIYRLPQKNHKTMFCGF